LRDRESAPSRSSQRASAGRARQLAEITPGNTPHFILPDVDATPQTRYDA
jgi:hypothetical protein